MGAFMSLLAFTLIPTISLLVLSILILILCVYSFILGDFIVKHGIEFKSSKDVTDYIFIEYITAPTDAVIVSSFLGMAAAAVAIVAYTQLKRQGMDMDYNMPRRRFWVGFVIMGALANIGSALAALALHSTSNRNSDAYPGCSVESTETTQSKNSILWCTREKALCDIIQDKIDKMMDDKTNKWAAPQACRVIQATKWMQLLLVLCSLVMIGLFGVQAWKRKKTRYDRVGVLGKSTPYKGTTPYVQSMVSLPMARDL
ncbi:hypothetical protein P154DRAFT_537049 [Amniculicola lignicola CBS 123094]|uniref:MARVEL domain-containing protein n=1 Tax=Amniculicola lignicola CBS 123094 TaxID=1392246 RepID=A0A6A5W8P9_9PLEO|nr:hypothetical protein P154DRAFT_537049 [Amniculicola lignicola CBS 123094]